MRRSGGRGAVGSGEGLKERVSALECAPRAGARILSAQWVRTLQNAEGVSEISVSSSLFLSSQSKLSICVNAHRPKSLCEDAAFLGKGCRIGKTYRSTIELCL